MKSKQAYNHKTPDPTPSKFVQMMTYGENLLALDINGRIWERQDPKFADDDHEEFIDTYSWKLVSQ